MATIAACAGFVASVFRVKAIASLAASRTVERTAFKGDGVAGDLTALAAIC